MFSVTNKYIYATLLGLIFFIFTNPSSGLIIERHNDKYIYNINYAGKLLYPILSIDDYIFYDKKRISNILKSYEFNSYLNPKNITLKFKKNRIEIIFDLNEKYHREEVYIYNNGLILENYVNINNYHRKYYNYEFSQSSSKDYSYFSLSILHRINEHELEITYLRADNGTNHSYEKIQKLLKININTTKSDFKVKYDSKLLNDFISFQHNFIFELDRYKPTLYGWWEIQNGLQGNIILDTFYCGIDFFIGICKDFKSNGNNGSFTLVYWDNNENKEYIEPIIYSIDPSTRDLKLKFTNYDDPWLNGKYQFYKDEYGNPKKPIFFGSSSYFTF
jgi:hypothetical protein